MKATVEVERKQEGVWRFCGWHASEWPPLTQGTVKSWDYVGPEVECDACKVAAYYNEVKANARGRRS